MTLSRAIGLIVGLIVLLGNHYAGENTTGCAFAQGPPPPPSAETPNVPPPTPAQEQPEVLTRGPVHEAFAEPVTLQAQAGLIIPNQPPANIEEIPPAERPQGDQFVWVPGYWSWDADRNDFVWVSACWRVAPPNMYWVPGYWAPVAAEQGGVNVGVGGVGVHVGGGVDVHVGSGIDVRVGGGRPEAAGIAGWEWVAGFWAPAAAQEIEYLPAPPAPIDLTPPGPPPAPDNMWVPGCWYWQEGQYVRRPGYWLRQQPDWVWEPSHYRWSPRGYVFEEGHWDYSLDRRGVLFAPVYIRPSVYSRAGFSYSPSIAIDIGVLSANLFIYPRYSHYYFGDYYDGAYAREGIYPQFETERNHTWYDPIYTYDRWHYGLADKHWDEHQRQEYDRLRADKNLRPARTYREMETRVARMPEAQRRNAELARPLATIAASKVSRLKFERINTDARQKITRQASDVYKFGQERGKWEATGSTNPKAVKPPTETRVPPGRNRARVATPADHKGTTTPPGERASGLVPPREVHLTQPERVKIPPPPIVGKPGHPSGREKGPPPRPADEQKHKAEAKDTHKDSGKKSPKNSREGK